MSVHCQQILGSFHVLGIGGTAFRCVYFQGASRQPATSAGYAGDKLKDALKHLGNGTIEIVERYDAARGFVLLPRRWVMERTCARLNRNRRLAKDVEANIESSTTWLYIAGVKLMTRRPAAA